MWSDFQKLEKKQETPNGLELCVNLKMWCCFHDNTMIMLNFLLHASFGNKDLFIFQVFLKKGNFDYCLRKNRQ